MSSRAHLLTAEEVNPWLGRLPRHWPVVSLSRCFTLMKREPAPSDGTVTAFRDGQVTLRSLRRIDGYTEAEKEIGYQGVRTGDLVIHAMDAFAGAIGVAEADGKSSPVYSVLRPRPGIDARYYAALLRHIAISGYIASLGKGVRERSTDFRWSDAKNVKVPLPPEEEQRRIAEFLDHETAQIDERIAKQEQLISTLAERRSAAVTKRVLGAPRWELQPLRWEIEFITSGSRGWAEFYSDTGAPFIRIGNLPRQSLELKRDEIQCVDIPVGTEGVRAVTQEGDLLFSITAYLGSVAVVGSADAGSYVSQHVALVRLRARRFLPRYVGYVALSVFGQQQLALGAYGGTKIQLSLEDIKSFVVPRPSLSEQEQIVRELDDLLADTDQLIRAAGSAIALLRERRQALISAAVTGQIDVGGAS